jgi:hypothetical protein
MVGVSICEATVVPYAAPKSCNKLVYGALQSKGTLSSPAIETARSPSLMCFPTWVNQDQ